ncbi:uncharacterized protein F4807DRAFT_387851 [Annulohypoxylon truncatum]|uniref:uncharacterized protein n=1 Tax=Annulohypoxylon truncatum TaxID=327061 RepID=UPI002007C6F5|nr:uncharacterized protein F4807DRAFT_387851 [Annulohypoxylon truncatum]KAI1212103.1 hypothetical protein F4807DRAFT_387851 [Annulohypoxylon truncatum]
MPPSNETRSPSSSENRHLPSEKFNILEEYLRSDPTVSERCSGLVNSAQATRGMSSHLDDVKDLIKGFDNVFAKNNRGGNQGSSIRVYNSKEGQ